jgi:hypothetical protein
MNGSMVQAFWKSIFLQKEQTSPKFDSLAGHGLISDNDIVSCLSRFLFLTKGEPLVLSDRSPNWSDSDPSSSRVSEEASFDKSE